MEVLLPKSAQLSRRQEAFRPDAGGGLGKILSFAPCFDVGFGDLIGVLRIEGFGRFPGFADMGFAPRKLLLKPYFDGVAPEADKFVLSDFGNGFGVFYGLVEKGRGGSGVCPSAAA